MSIQEDIGSRSVEPIEKRKTLTSFQNYYYGDLESNRVAINKNDKFYSKRSNHPIKYSHDEFFENNQDEVRDDSKPYKNSRSNSIKITSCDNKYNQANKNGVQSNSKKDGQDRVLTMITNPSKKSRDVKFLTDLSKGSSRKTYLTPSSFSKTLPRSKERVSFSEPRTINTSKNSCIGGNIFTNSNSDSIDKNNNNFDDKILNENQVKNFTILDTVDAINLPPGIKKKKNILEAGKILIDSATNVNEYITDRDLIKATSFKMNRDRVNDIINSDSLAPQENIWKK